MIAGSSPKARSPPSGTKSSAMPRHNRGNAAAPDAGRLGSSATASAPHKCRAAGRRFGLELASSARDVDLSPARRTAARRCAVRARLPASRIRDRIASAARAKGELIRQRQRLAEPARADDAIDQRDQPRGSRHGYRFASWRYRHGRAGTEAPANRPRPRAGGWQRRGAARAGSPGPGRSRPAPPCRGRAGTAGPGSNGTSRWETARGCRRRHAAAIARTASAARDETGTNRSLSPFPRSIRNGWPGRTARRGNETSSVARRPEP